MNNNPHLQKSKDNEPSLLESGLEHSNSKNHWDNFKFTESKGGMLMKATLNDGSTTSCAKVIDIHELQKLIESNEFEDVNSAAFHTIKQLVGFIVVRSKMENYLKYVNGFMHDFNDFAKRGDLTLLQPNKKLTVQGESVLQKYTTAKNWYCTRVNLLLAIDLINGEHATYAKQLKACIGWQTPKYIGKVYRGMLLSPFELFTMAFKKTFYIPSFTSAAICPEKIIFSPVPMCPKPYTGYQNVILEIDTSEFPNFSTIIQCNQSDFDESECLMSCYNIYSWQGLRVIKYTCVKTQEVVNVPIISLKLENYNSVHDLDTQTVKGDHDDLNEIWVQKKVSQVQCNKLITPETFIANFNTLIVSYNRNEKRRTDGKSRPLTWLNADYVVIDETLQTYGRSINGIEFQKLIDTQNTTTTTTTTTISTTQ